MLLKKSQVLGPNLPAVKNPTDDCRFGGASITLPRSPASFSSGSEVPHIFARESCVRPREILITSAKRLFQQHRSKPERLRASTRFPLTPQQRTFERTASCAASCP